MVLTLHMGPLLADEYIQYVWKYVTHLMLALVLVLSQGLVGHEPVPFPATPVPACNDASESYYEEAQPYGEPFNGKNRNPSQRQNCCS